MLNDKILKNLMEEKGILSIKDLSSKTKIPFTTLYYMLSGHDMYLSNILTLSKFFNVPVDYLIDKYYGIITVSENKSIFSDSSSLVEVTLKNSFNIS